MEGRRRRATRRVAVLFALGSVCFALASVASQWASAPRPWIGATFFLGSLLFTGGAFGQWWEVGHAEAVRHRDWLAAVVQLGGTLFFNVSTFAALQRGLTTHQTNLRVWTPDAFGSMCFLVSSGIAYAAGAGRAAALNLVGSIAFGAAAVTSLIEPSTGEPVSAVIANATTTAGALCFLAGALLSRPGAHAPAGPSRIAAEQGGRGLTPPAT